MSSDSKPIGALWYLAALCLAIIGWNVGVAVAGGAWDEVREARITSANQRLSAQGSSVAVFTDVLEADLAIRCSWRTNGTWHHMAPAPIGLTVDDDGMSWQLIAFEPQGHDRMQVQCRPTRGRTDNAQYAYAVVEGFNDRAELGRWIIVATLGSALVATVVIFVLRRRRPTRSDT